MGALVHPRCSTYNKPRHLEKYSLTNFTRLVFALYSCHGERVDNQSNLCLNFAFELDHVRQLCSMSIAQRFL